MPGRQSQHCTLDWRTSRYSANGSECVEIASAEQSVLVRDSRNPAGAVLQFSLGQWSSFTRRVRADPRFP
jgi:Domain of unknown function (DUF397)